MKEKDHYLRNKHFIKSFFRLHCHQMEIKIQITVCKVLQTSLMSLKVCLMTLIFCITCNIILKVVFFTSTLHFSAAARLSPSVKVARIGDSTSA